MKQSARALAVTALCRQEKEQTFSHLVIDGVARHHDLKKEDFSLFVTLYLGVLEKKITLAHIVSKYAKLPLEKIDEQTKNALYIGLYQLLYMDKIPDFSAVCESVECAPNKSKGFVNGILRTFLREEKQCFLPSENTVKALSICTSFPEELITLWSDSYGFATAQKLCEYSGKERALSLRVNTLKITEQEAFSLLEKRGLFPKKSTLCQNLILCKTDISSVENDLANGLFFVQDESSKLSTELIDAQPNQTILDACACPGGKSFSMAIDMQNQGKIVSCDLHQSKIGLISKGAEALGICMIESKIQNGKEYVSDWERSFDKVLCDVPCSGLGVVYKKPEIRYKEIEQINALSPVQYEILCNCSAYVKVGGELYYSTCTLNEEENGKTVMRFLESHPSFEPVDFTVGERSSKNGTFTFFPHLLGTDGFFIAKMRRKSQ